MLRRVSLAIIATSVALWAQENTGISIAIFPPPVAAFAELKQQLGLSDAQVEQLRKLLE